MIVHIVIGLVFMVLSWITSDDEDKPANGAQVGYMMGAIVFAIWAAAEWIKTK